MKFIARFELVIATCGILLSSVVRSQVLEAVKCSPEFPSGTVYMSSIYAGEDRGIYLFGGWDPLEGRSNAIYRYDVIADTLARVGDLPIGTDGSGLAEDSQGNLLHFGGWDGGIYLDTITRFDTSTNVTELVGRLPKAINTIGTVQYKPDSALVFGIYDIFEVNLSTYQVTEVGETTKVSRGLAWDGDDKVLLLYGEQHQLYSISGSTYTDFTSPIRHRFELFNSVISTPKSAFVVGNRGDFVGSGNGIFEVDFDTLEFTFWPVDKYPALSNGVFYYAATTYVPELHRLYMFGGYNGSWLGEIWYIDLPGGGQVTTTSLPTTSTSSTTTPTPTTTTPPPTTTPAVTTTTQSMPTSTLKPCGHAQCPPSVDGNFPDPQDCTGFVQCVAGTAFCHDCQDGLYYHIELDKCDYPENVDCGSRPIP